MNHLLLKENKKSGDDASGEAKAGGRGDFFAIDHRAWQRACDLGLNTAVTYLLLARGTLKDNRTTRWSVNATEGRTGISRPKAKVALETLIASGLVENLNSSPTRPKRRLVPGHLLPRSCEGQLQLDEQTVQLLGQMPLAASKLSQVQKEQLDAAILAGTVRYNGFRYFQVDPTDEKPDWIWLPNSLIDGASDEVAPVEKLRMAQDLPSLRLLIDLYHIHSLSFSGGVPPMLLWTAYDANEVAHQRSYRIWDVSDEAETFFSMHSPFFQQFWRSANGKTKQATDEFWRCFNLLTSLGYIHIVQHLLEGDSWEAEIIHPFDTGFYSPPTSAEKRLYEAARNAAMALLPECMQPAYCERDIVPVRDYISNISSKGIVRLHYRPRTIVTAQWMALSEKWDRYAQHFEDLLCELPPVKPLF